MQRYGTAHVFPRALQADEIIEVLRPSVAAIIPAGSSSEIRPPPAGDPRLVELIRKLDDMSRDDMSRGARRPNYSKSPVRPDTFWFVRNLDLFEVWVCSKFRFVRTLGLCEVWVCLTSPIRGSSG